MEMEMEILSAKECLEAIEKGALATEKGAFGINFNGQTLGNYMSHSSAVAKGMICTAKNTTEKDIDDWYVIGGYGNEQSRIEGFDTLLNTAVWNTGAFSVRYPIANGSYSVDVIIAENYKDYCRSFTVKVEGSQYVATIPKMRKGEVITLRRQYSITDGYVNIDVIPIDNPEVHLMGMYVVSD